MELFGSASKFQKFIHPICICFLREKAEVCLDQFSRSRQFPFIAKSCPTLLQLHGLLMEFLRQEYWSWLPFPSLELPNPRVKPASPALPGRFPTAEPSVVYYFYTNITFFIT